MAPAVCLPMKVNRAEEPLSQAVQVRKICQAVQSSNERVVNVGHPVCSEPAWTRFQPPKAMLHEQGVVTGGARCCGGGVMGANGLWMVALLRC